jgi:glycosyltransferase involved in cell wall biosynthesis
MSGVGLLPKILKEKYDIPIVITEHYSGYALNTVNNNDLFQAKENLKKADKFFAVSNFYRDKLNRLFNSDKIKTVPNNLGEEVEGFGKYVKKNEIFTFIVVGNLFSIKNQKIAIIAFKEYLKFHPNAILNIVGMGGEYINLKKLTIDLKIQDHVFFLGKLDRSDTLFQISKSHVLLVTSKVETFSVVTIEALALETLVISTKCGGPEMLINDSNGIICDNPSLYYQSMIEIYENYENYDLRRVRSECISKYSGRNISKILIKEYSKLLYSEK